MYRYLGWSLCLTLGWSSVSFAQPSSTQKDERLVPARTLNEKDFFLKVPASKEAWEARKQAVRTQVLVGNGLWPLPEKTALQPVLHGKIEKQGYTIEKVYFASYPGHYVTGNLYRPTGKTGKLPGVLCPHGHWANGRFFEASEANAKKQVDKGAEQRLEGAKYPLQARCAQLAKLGCVVFHYDMVGYADSLQIKHREGFVDAQAELWLQSFMGLQTWNSIRALDFLVALPDVDPARVGVTGASGGGTQTFLLCGIDDRPAVAFPAVMVSTAMQGGCVCENCSYLRVGTGNIELAGLFAPKPLAMSGANDWTIDIETKGLPELKQLYKLYGVEENVHAKCYPQFEHNYNQVSRELMYNWFNKHLKLGAKEPVVEQPFEPVPPKELAVFSAQQPAPKDAVNSEVLRKYLTEQAQKQLAALKPTDANKLKEYRQIVGSALNVLLDNNAPNPGTTVVSSVTKEHNATELILSRTGRKEMIPTLALTPKPHNGNWVIWVHPQGRKSVYDKGKLAPAAEQILAKGTAILVADLFQTGELVGEKPFEVNKSYAGFTFGYNRSVLAQRVQDIITLVGYLDTFERKKETQVGLLGLDKAGPWALLARALLKERVTRAAVDLHQFQFESLQATSDEMFLSGALKYGGLDALAGIGAGPELYVSNSATDGAWLKASYAAVGKPENLQHAKEAVATEKLLAWLLR